MSVGGSYLSFPRWVLLLFHCDVFGVGPIHVSSKPVAPCGFTLVLGFFVDAGHAVVFDSNWMKTMRAAVRSHVPEFLKLAPLAAFVCSAVGVDILAIRLGLGLLLNMLAMLAMVAVSFLISSSIVVNLFVV
jgi:hypothetical protein